MKSLKILSQVFLICITIALCSGCANQKTWVYRSNSYPLPAATSGKTIAVLPFEDARTNENHNLIGLYFVPLMPFGWQNLNSPEGSSQHFTSGLWVNFKPTEDFPKALAEDLRNTHLFSDAFFDYRRETGDYAVTGKITNTKYKARMFSYGLSVYGADLWFIGFPAGWTKNELSIDLTLMDSKTQKVLLSKTYTATPRSDVSWLYYLRSDFNYAEMLAELNKQFCTDIQSIVQNNTKP